MTTLTNDKEGTPLLANQHQMQAMSMQQTTQILKELLEIFQLLVTA